jgi:hypothetical protein
MRISFWLLPLTAITMFVISAPSTSRADALVCKQLFGRNVEQPLSTEYIVEFNDSNGLKLLRTIHRIVTEYPLEYMETSRTIARVTVPESRWQEIFLQDYQSVMNELSKVEITKVETFADGTQVQSLDAPVLISFCNDEFKNFPREWVPLQKSFSFQFDRRILDVMQKIQEPAVATWIFRDGVIAQSQESDDDKF